MQSGHTYVSQACARARSRSPSPAREAIIERRRIERKSAADRYRGHFLQVAGNESDGSNEESSKIECQKKRPENAKDGHRSNFQVAGNESDVSSEERFKIEHQQKNPEFVIDSHKRNSLRIAEKDNDGSNGESFQIEYQKKSPQIDRDSHRRNSLQIAKKDNDGSNGESFIIEHQNKSPEIVIDSRRRNSSQIAERDNDGSNGESFQIEYQKKSPEIDRDSHRRNSLQIAKKCNDGSTGESFQIEYQKKSPEIYRDSHRRNFHQFAKKGNYGSNGEICQVDCKKSKPHSAEATVSPPSSSLEVSEFTQLLQKNLSALTKMDDMAGAVRNYGSTSSPSQTDSGREDIISTATVSSNFTSSESHSANNILESKHGQFKRQKSYYTPSMVDELRKRNRLSFMDPITKLRNFHGFPWKLSLQIVKLILITVQIVIFGGQRENTVEYFERSELAYKHLLLKDWNVAYETMPYPPAAGQYAVYNMSDLFDHMNSVLERYYTIPEVSLASVRHNIDKHTRRPYPIKLCFRANDFLEYPNGSYVVSATILNNCTFLHTSEQEYNIQRYLKRHNFTLPFNKTLDITLSFYFRTFHLNVVKTHYGPTCYNVSISIVYTNVERSGQILIDLDSESTEINCEGKIMSEEAEEQQESVKAQLIVFDAFVMAVCFISTILCSRSLIRCNKLRLDTAQFFKLHKGKPFSFSNHLEYINMWYIIIICNDVLTVIGSAFKIELESRAFSISSNNYEVCSILLGVGVFLTYIGILRYLGFFQSYNILILTLKTSFPHVLRFLVCAICLFAGFLICGWVVFSPYHIKFRTLSTAAECLFSLVNGDDMFVTFSALSENSSDAIWYIHRIYSYIFISIFIYVVISVFIAVIMENYENLKHYYIEGFNDTDVQKFIKEDGEMSMAEIFRHVNRENKWQNWFFCLFPCFSCFRSDLKKGNMRKITDDLFATI